MAQASSIPFHHATVEVSSNKIIAITMVWEKDGKVTGTLQSEIGEPKFEKYVDKMFDYIDTFYYDRQGNAPSGSFDFYKKAASWGGYIYEIYYRTAGGSGLSAMWEAQKGK